MIAFFKDQNVLYFQWEKWENQEIINQMDTVTTAVNIARSSKALYGLTRRHLPDILILAESEEIKDQIKGQKELFEELVPCGNVQVTNELQSNIDIRRWCQQKLPDMTIFMKLEGQVDVEKEVRNIQEKMAKLETNAAKLQAKIDKRPNEAIQIK